MILIINDNDSVLCLDNEYRRNFDFKNSKTSAKVYVRLQDAKKKALSYGGKVVDIPEDLSVQKNGEVYEYESETEDSEGSFKLHRLSDFIVYNSKMTSGKTKGHIKKIQTLVEEISKMNGVKPVEKIETLAILERFFEQKKLEILSQERLNKLRSKKRRIYKKR